MSIQPTGKLDCAETALHYRERVRRRCPRAWNASA